MVLVFSSNANASPQIKREVDRAVSKGLTIIPIRIEDVAPTRALEYYISPVHWLDAVVPPLEPHLEALAEKIQVLLDRAEADRAARADGDRATTAAASGHVASPPIVQPAGVPSVPVASVPVVSAPVATASVATHASPTPAPPRRVRAGAMVGGGVAVAAIVALLWAQPWNPGADKTREAAARQAIDEQRRLEAARQAEIDEQRRRDRQQADGA